MKEPNEKDALIKELVGALEAAQTAIDYRQLFFPHGIVDSALKHAKEAME